MDPSISNLVLPGGLGGVLALIIIHLFRQNGQDRKHAREELSTIQAEHALAMRTMAESHAQQLADVHGQIQNLRTEVQEIMEKYENERERRWEAEERLAIFRREHGIPRADPGPDQRPAGI